MGCSSSTELTGEPDDITIAINKWIYMHDRRNRCINRILLLGTESSGKSTVAKQVSFIYNNGSNIQTSAMIENIRAQCISFILKFCKIIDDNQSIEKIQYHESQHQFNEIGNIIQSIWSKHRHKIMKNNKYDQDILSIAYFLDKIQYITDDNYILTERDILSHHCKSHSALQIEYEFKEYEYCVIDINHKQMCRKNLYIFDNVDGLVFVAALSDFSTNNDYNINAMKHSIDLFKDIVNLKWFQRTDISLFLNKRDLFEKNLRNGESLSKCFGDDWKGKEFINNKIPLIVSYIIRKVDISVPVEIMNVILSYSRLRYIINEKEVDEELYFSICVEEAVDFIEQRYIECSQHTKKVVFIHTCTATDKCNMQSVFWNVQNLLISSNMRIFSQP
eukprot:251617_1